MALALHVAEVHRPLRVFTGLGQGRIHRLVAEVAVEDLYRRQQGVHAVDVQPWHHGGLGGIFLGDDEAAHPPLAGGNGGVEAAIHRAHPPVQAQFAQDDGMGELAGRHLPAHGQDGEGNGEVQRGALLAHIPGGEVAHHFAIGEGEVGVLDGAADALAALHHGLIGQADEVEIRGAPAQVHFDHDGHRLDSHQGGGFRLGDHGRSVPPPRAWTEGARLLTGLEFAFRVAGDSSALGPGCGSPFRRWLRCRPRGRGSRPGCTSPCGLVFPLAW